MCLRNKEFILKVQIFNVNFHFSIDFLRGL